MGEKVKFSSIASKWPFSGDYLKVNNIQLLKEKEDLAHYLP